jgi:hypothetical protein
MYKQHLNNMQDIMNSTNGKALVTHLYYVTAFMLDCIADQEQTFYTVGKTRDGSMFALNFTLRGQKKTVTGKNIVDLFSNAVGYIQDLQSGSNGEEDDSFF